MKAKGQGAYEKYKVARTDGRSGTGEKHQGCRYFVLDLDHDPYAGAALRAYAKECEGAYPALASDLAYAAERIESDHALARLPDPEVDLGFREGHVWA